MTHCLQSGSMLLTLTPFKPEKVRWRSSSELRERQSKQGSPTVALSLISVWGHLSLHAEHPHPCPSVLLQRGWVGPKGSPWWCLRRIAEMNEVDQAKLQPGASRASVFGAAGGELESVFGVHWSRTYSFAGPNCIPFCWEMLLQWRIFFSSKPLMVFPLVVLRDSLWLKIIDP